MNLSNGDTQLIIDTCKSNGLLRNQCGYVLGTSYHESGHTMKPINEIWGPTAAQRRYEGRVDLGNTVKGDGRRFAGRGYVQITGRRNYTDWSKRLGVDLVGNPALALVAENAVRILVEGMKLGTFTGKKLSDYVTLSKSDFTNARRVINGTDRADLIAGYAKQYDTLLIADGYGTAAPQAASPEPATPIPAPQTPAPVTAAPVPQPELHHDNAPELSGNSGELANTRKSGVSKPAAAAGALVLTAAAIAAGWHHITQFVSNLF